MSRIIKRMVKLFKAREDLMVMEVINEDSKGATIMMD